MMEQQEDTMQKIYRLAALAKLDLREEEALRLSADMQEIIAFTEKLSSADLEQLPMTIMDATAADDLRDDLSTPCLERDALLQNASISHDAYFILPRILEE